MISTSWHVPHIGLHTAFPPAFAAVGRALWLPLLLALVGIVFRGAGFALHAHAVGAVRQQAVWGAVFAFASTAAPFFLGAARGAIASGQLAVTPQGDYTGNYVTGWLSPLSIFTAFFAVGVCAYLACAGEVRTRLCGGVDQGNESRPLRPCARGRGWADVRTRGATGRTYIRNTPNSGAGKTIC